MFTKTVNLLSVGKDAKTIKGEKVGVITGILYLAPHTLSGYQACPNATEGCKAVCLYKAGMGAYTNVQNARINRTKWFFEDRKSFMETLAGNIQSLIKKAEKVGMIVGVRLNGTSDIAWEKIKIVIDGIEYKNLMEAFPSVQYYEYTKIYNRKSALNIPNYHLTFSLAEDNDKDAVKALKAGFNVAVVMDVGRKDAKPKTWSGYKVIDGDVNDARFKDKGKGSIIALTAKGPARKDKSGFVRNINSLLTVKVL